ncbi:uncharacterized protein LOC124373056, partial [Homalodisca vitripennis]|uniref:uncharacterized protein LOC124373056 n=1 Tax=Homalodisca vitripennis TaxID=197043 RepID=UPI001EEA119D
MASLQDLPDISTISVKDEAYIDPADYIFQHSEYHDVTFNVGSNNDKTETIRAVKVHLIAHSPVFRQLLLNNKANTRVCISDVSPEIFKLILRHVYGGEISSLDPSTAGQLALTADTFNIRPLVKKACMLIVPKSANDVFPALLCVANISCPELEPQVTKIVQEETQALLNSKYFLDLDTKSLEFISRQERLSVTELELWRALVRWAQNKATTNSEKTLRQHLQLILPNVRLLTFSPEDISKEVICTKILKSDEVVELLSAIANKHTLDLPGFCSSYKLRKQPDTVTDHKSALTINCLLRRDICEKKFNLNEFSQGSPSLISSVSIYTTEDILIESFGVRS